MPVAYSSQGRLQSGRLKEYDSAGCFVGESSRVGRVHQSRGLIHNLSRSPEVAMQVGCLGVIKETLPSLKKFDGTKE